MNLHSRVFVDTIPQVGQPAIVEGRAGTLDSARGIAMLMVCFSHFSITYFARAGAFTHAHFAWYVGLPTSGMFMLLSGLTIGLLRQKSANHFTDIRLKFADRGLFLLVPAHFLILVAHHWVGLSLGPGTNWFFITDAIGILTCPRVFGPLIT